MTYLIIGAALGAIVALAWQNSNLRYRLDVAKRTIEGQKRWVNIP